MTESLLFGALSDRDRPRCYRASSHEPLTCGPPAPGTLPKVFVANKVDLEKQEVPEEEIKMIAGSLGYKYVMCSAKDGPQGPEKAFICLAGLVGRPLNHAMPTLAIVVPTSACAIQLPVPAP